MKLKNIVDELNEERMNEPKFWGYVMDDGEEFSYGRDVLKEGTYEDHLNLPYTSFPLFASNNSWIGDKTAQVG